MALALLGIALAGCGGGSASGEEPGEDAYHEVLVGLRTAVAADRRYEPIQRPADSDPEEWAVAVAVPPSKYLKHGEEGVVVALCETAWQLAINSETGLLAQKGFIFTRIRGRAEVILGRTPAGRHAARLAMPELARVLDLASYDAEANSRYRKACGL